MTGELAASDNRLTIERGGKNYLLRRFQSTKTMSATMATVMIMPVHIPVSKTSPMTPQPDITDNSGAKHAILKCLIIWAPC